MKEEAKKEKEQMLTTFDENFRDKLHKKKSTIDSISIDTKIPKSTINSYINGEIEVRKMPSIINIKKIAKALNTSIDSLVFSDKDAEILYTVNPRVSTILRNLYKVIAQAHLQIIEDNEHIYFSTKNKYIRFFFNEVKEYLQDLDDKENAEHIEKACERFSDLKIYKGDIVDAITYRHHCREEFIYEGTINGKDTEEHLTPINDSDFEECDGETIRAEINRRINIWNEKYSEGSK